MSDFTHHNFFDALMRSAGVTAHSHISVDPSEEWACDQLKAIFKDVGLNEVIIASGNTTIKVESKEEVESKWDELVQCSSQMVYIYRMPQAVWYGIQARLRREYEVPHWQEALE